MSCPKGWVVRFEDGSQHALFIYTTFLPPQNGTIDGWTKVRQNTVIPSHRSTGHPDGSCHLCWRNVDQLPVCGKGKRKVLYKEMPHSLENKENILIVRVLFRQFSTPFSTNNMLYLMVAFLHDRVRSYKRQRYFH